jgi:hypothetical protein
MVKTSLAPGNALGPAGGHLPQVHAPEDATGTAVMWLRSDDEPMFVETFQAALIGVLNRDLQVAYVKQAANIQGGLS